MIPFDHQVLHDLLQNKIAVDQFEIGFVKIGAPLRDIDIFEINDIYVQQPGEEKYNMNNSDFTIRERLEQLQSANGWIHLAGGLTCSITNQRIDNIRLTKKYIHPVVYYDRNSIFKYFGEPDYELIDHVPWGLENTVESYILVYNNKRLNFYFDPETGGLLKEIYTARLDTKNFMIRN